MKLARPDVFHPRIVLAGCPQQVTGDGDDAALVAALRQRGLQAQWMSWDDPEVGDADLVILRATRDYPSRLDEFLAWTTGVQNLLNPPAVVSWNVDRRYLADLADRGVPTVPGVEYAAGDRVELPHTGSVFVSPAVGTGTRCFSDRSAAAAHVAELQKAGQRALVQAAGADPQTVLVFLGGAASHAFTTQDHSALRQGEPDFEIWDVGAAALAAAANPGELLYARVHLIGSRVLELQLVDPSLGWRRLDAGTRELAQRQFAVCVESALDRLGLGPLSRPGSH
jgi:hypothetical protein